MKYLPIIFILTLASCSNEDQELEDMRQLLIQSDDQLKNLEQTIRFNDSMILLLSGTDSTFNYDSISLSNMIVTYDSTDQNGLHLERSEKAKYQDSVDLHK